MARMKCSVFTYLDLDPRMPFQFLVFDSRSSSSSFCKNDDVPMNEVWEL